MLFLSLHGDPRQCFPYFLGHAEEIGCGKGEGFNVNYPLPPGTDFAAWAGALDDALERIRAAGCELLVVSLGVDAFENDPISEFKLTSDDFTEVGRRLAGLGLPTTFLLEGGYAVEEIGINVVNVLSGFEAERRLPSDRHESAGPCRDFAPRSPPGRMSRPSRGFAVIGESDVSGCQPAQLQGFRAA